jgi:hypothetical protein
MNGQIHSILERMKTITLEEMKNIHLMDRVDFKYVIPVSLLPQLLEEMIPYFKVQINNEKRIASYSTQYLDTPDLKMYITHQNGKLNRQKIRIRSYLDSKVSFLEIKNKNNKGRTSKTRVPVQRSFIETIDDLNVDNQQFIAENSRFDIKELTPSLSNTFNRITLVNNKATERVTVDLDLSFRNYKTGEAKQMSEIVVLELKQNGWQYSDFRTLLSQFRIKRLSFSKYCMGTVLTNPDIKYNEFKKKWKILNKITQ